MQAVTDRGAGIRTNQTGARIPTVSRPKAPVMVRSELTKYNAAQRLFNGKRLAICRQCFAIVAIFGALEASDKSGVRPHLNVVAGWPISPAFVGERFCSGCMLNVGYGCVVPRYVARNHVLPKGSVIVAARSPYGAV
jgi:hypothetical protein